MSDEGGLGGGEDRISNLPEAVRGSILSLLSTVESVRTSVVSPGWRRAWTLAPLRIYDEDLTLFRRRWLSARGIYDSEFERLNMPCNNCWLIQAIDAIIAQHRGLISSFNVSRTGLSPASCLCSFKKSFNQSFDMWIENLAGRDSVQHLTLRHMLPAHLLTSRSLCKLTLVEFDSVRGVEQLLALPPNLTELSLEAICLQRDTSAIPQGVVACESLRSLELAFYTLKEPLGMQMPPNLTQLKLQCCYISDSLVSHVLSTCHSLVTLGLSRCFGLKNVGINSSSLKKLTLCDTNSFGEPWDSSSDILEVITGSNRMPITCYAPYHLLIGDAPSLEELVLREFHHADATVRIMKAPKLREVSHTPQPHLKILREQSGSLMGDKECRIGEGME